MTSLRHVPTGGWFMSVALAKMRASTAGLAERTM
jgi:hypothetical protein